MWTHVSIPATVGYMPSPTHPLTSKTDMRRSRRSVSPTIESMTSSNPSSSESHTAQSNLNRYTESIRSTDSENIGGRMALPPYSPVPCGRPMHPPTNRKHPIRFRLRRASPCAYVPGAGYRRTGVRVQPSSFSSSHLVHNADRDRQDRDDHDEDRRHWESLVVRNRSLIHDHIAVEPLP